MPLVNLDFKYFLDKYYLPSQLHQLEAILKKYTIYTQIKETIDDFYIEAKVNNLDDLNIQLILTISDYTCIVNNLLKDITDPAKKKDLQLILTELAIYLIKETYNISNYSRKKYFKILKSTLKKVYNKNKWNFEELDRLLNLDTIEKFAEENNTNSEGGKAVVAKAVCFVWKGDKHLDLFIADFKSFFKIKSNKVIHYLFQSIITQFEIHVSPEQLPNLLVLFDTLHSKKIIKVEGNRGIFTYLEKHIKPTKSNFPIREFRKLKYEISQNTKLYKDIESVVNSVFGKYYSKGQ